MRNLLLLSLLVISLLVVSIDGFSQVVVQSQINFFWTATGSNTIWFEIRPEQQFRFYEVKEYRWYFGDGAVINTQELRLPHVYPMPGKFLVQVNAITYSGVEYRIVETWVIVPQTIVFHTIDFSKLEPAVQITLILSIAAVIIVAMIYGHR